MYKIITEKYGHGERHKNNLTWREAIVIAEFYAEVIAEDWMRISKSHEEGAYMDFYEEGKILIVRM